MQQKTEDEYISLANHFYGTYIKGKPTFNKINRALLDNAYDYRPDYFRRLRRAIQVDQELKGFRKSAKLIGEIKNPITNPKTNNSGIKSLLKTKPKQKRIKKVNRDDLSKLLTAVQTKKDKPLLAAICIATTVGCRPAEMESIRCIGNNTIFITGAKKSRNSDNVERGLDRQIILTPKIYTNMQSWMKELYALDPGVNGRINKLQCSLRRLCQKTFPRRKHHISLYSLRHQKGSDLKSSGKSRLEIAYMMGHQSTESIEVYGNKKSGGKMTSPIKAAVSESVIKTLVREKHKSPYSEQLKNKGSINIKPKGNVW